VVLLIRLLRESVLFAYSSVIVNKLRTILTLLGITIGIFAIIAVFTILDSFEANVRESVSSMGENVIRIEKWPWEFSDNYPWWVYMNRPEATLSEYKEVKKRSQLAEMVCFCASKHRQVKYKNNYSDRITISMNSFEYYDIRPFDFEYGRYFTNIESEFGHNCCILGYDVATQLFENQNPVGKEISLQGNKVLIVGVAKKMGKDVVGEGSLDEMVLIPVNYGKQLFDLKQSDSYIKVKAKPAVEVADLQEELKVIMRSIRRIKPLDKDNFALNQASLFSKILDSIFGAINIGGWIIGGFSILVGGFGIANIMFVSVRERTNIIGIQKACGAKNYVILVQFLFESVILALAGGLIGLFFVFLGTQIAKSMGDFIVILSLKNIVLGLSVSGIIGLISGFIPAWVASRLNPVEAINTHF
jgi:putative ABC transport system permease protein